MFLCPDCAEDRQTPVCGYSLLLPLPRCNSFLPSLPQLSDSRRMSLHWDITPFIPSESSNYGVLGRCGQPTSGFRVVGGYHTAGLELNHDVYSFECETKTWKMNRTEMSPQFRDTNPHSVPSPFHIPPVHSASALLCTNPVNNQNNDDSYFLHDYTLYVFDRAPIPSVSSHGRKLYSAVNRNMHISFKSAFLLDIDERKNINSNSSPSDQDNQKETAEEKLQWRQVEFCGEVPPCTTGAAWCHSTYLGGILVHGGMNNASYIDQQHYPPPTSSSDELPHSSPSGYGRLSSSNDLYFLNITSSRTHFAGEWTTIRHSKQARISPNLQQSVSVNEVVEMNDTNTCTLCGLTFHCKLYASHIKKCCEEARLRNVNCSPCKHSLPFVGQKPTIASEVADGTSESSSDAVPSPRHGHTITEIGSCIWMFGGMGAAHVRGSTFQSAKGKRKHQHLNDLFMFDLSATHLVESSIEGEMKRRDIPRTVVYEMPRCTGSYPSKRAGHSATSLGPQVFCVM